ncbi:hypothetical protein [Elioraea thermophila]|uniref:hypothetical protein n=1 Tax=Elioraea thermophila TaxID=2185104 RepID=UPI000DF3C8A7|nr:hypothetical protein [Elioraea thermophila]
MTTDPALAESHARLKRLIMQKRLILGVNIGLMSRPGSPVFRRIETALPLGLGMFGVIAATVFGGVWLGILALTLGIVVWFLFLLPRIKDQVYDRTLAYVLSAPEAFAQVWQAGAVTLRAGERECRPPEGDWQRFVRETKTREEEMETLE